MKNHDAAAGFVHNALAYAKDIKLDPGFRLQTVIANLEEIERLLDEPNAEYTGDVEFK